ncbi:YobI family P-loop NTPase, partial [Enterococcus innesii]|uniref:YobI family P-loop NTPase n=1 Tax=Enterococcus innesii TaxID=2839759 RepID=UPI003F83DB28
MISYNFKKLTPEKNIENLTTYQEAIDYALDDEEVRNIAITGIYGSGKSSIIETYKNKTKKNRKFIHISLAHFQQIGNDKPPKNLSKNKVLEGKILNQLLHQINSSDIPQTIFKVKNNISRKKIFIWSLVTSLISLSIFYLIAFEPWEKFVL